MGSILSGVVGDDAIDNALIEGALVGGEILEHHPREALQRTARIRVAIRESVAILFDENLGEGVDLAGHLRSPVCVALIEPTGMRGACQAPRACPLLRLHRDHAVEEEALPCLRIEVEHRDQVALILPRVRALHGALGQERGRARRAHGADRAILLLKGDQHLALGEEREGIGRAEGDTVVHVEPLALSGLAGALDLL